MNDTLGIILKTDKMAQEKVKEAECYRQSRLSSLTDKKTALARQAAQEAKEKARKESEKALKEGESLLESRAKESAKITNRMDELYKKNAALWVDEMFKKVTQI